MGFLERIAVLDFGGQYTQLIARRIRELGVYSEILPHDAPLEKVRGASGVILSGAFASVYREDAPPYDEGVFSLGVPVLGICYGHQLIGHRFQGSVKPAGTREYGRTHVRVSNPSPLLAGWSGEETVWMSHGDVVEKEPPGFEVLATTDGGQVAAMAQPSQGVYGVQFHPEVLHTPKGTLLLENFVRTVCGCTARWSMEDYIQKTQRYVRETIGPSDALVLVSGGVDSTVAAALVAKTSGIGRVHALHIDTGLMRKDESRQVEAALRTAGVENLAVVDASEEFLTALQGVTDPEQKRKTIGDLFIRIQAREVAKLGLDPDRTFLVQGTLYTDLVESGRGKGAKTAVIKSHHNVNSPLVEEKRKKGLIVEPNREIFKDEVRRVGELLGLPEELVWRHPFPGPGLAIRILGEITRERLDLLREVDAVFLEEIKRAGLYRKIWQAFAVLLPVRSVGVMGDERTYSYAVALRAVDSSDGMTADWSRVPHEVLERVASRVVNEVKGVNRVLFDITSKPPATIEFE